MAKHSQCLLSKAHVCVHIGRGHVIFLPHLRKVALGQSLLVDLTLTDSALLDFQGAPGILFTNVL